MDQKILNQKEIQKYFLYLIGEAINANVTASKSINDILIEKAILYGRPIDIAREDVRMVINVVSAINILLNRFTSHELDAYDNSS